ncbi:ATP-binding protein [Pseudomonas sp. BYT-5]|uniref:ATP-binding protein n=1 Tax=unclassified Pseudomonas TaxID=196821 RepID=UPI0020203D53|nr:MULTISPECIES: ATP-binding protein [unclassified Pseudomonas]URD40673.1 ATP-binding protein [Pseudomonas sp. BYT-5]URK96033.1 ATP-binding protein [Pseudomonas sp. BYT-1]
MRSEKVVHLSSMAGPQVTSMAMCEEHGPYQATTHQVLSHTFRSPCPGCKAAQAEKALAEDAKRQRLDLAYKLGDSLIPKRFKDKTFATYAATSEGQHKAKARCERYAAEFEMNLAAGRCLILVGNPGTGKTHLGVSIAQAVMTSTRHAAAYRTLGGILQSIRATFDGSSGQTESSILDALIKPALLVLDEVGASKEAPSDFELSRLFSIINGRYEKMLPTIVISNLGARELPAAMGERSADRLREGGGIVLPFDWSSHRGKEPA